MIHKKTWKTLIRVKTSLKHFETRFDSIAKKWSSNLHQFKGIRNRRGLSFQIISDLVLAATDEAEGGSKYVPDAMSAEYAVETIDNILPAILAKNDPPRKSVQSEKASLEISNWLISCSIWHTHF